MEAIESLNVFGASQLVEVLLLLNAETTEAKVFNKVGKGNAVGFAPSFSDEEIDLERTFLSKRARIAHTPNVPVLSFFDYNSEMLEDPVRMETFVKDAKRFRIGPIEELDTSKYSKDLTDGYYLDPKTDEVFLVVSIGDFVQFTKANLELEIITPEDLGFYIANSADPSLREAMQIGLTAYQEEMVELFGGE